MTNILIVNFVSRLNKGSCALLNCKIKLLKDVVSDTKFTVSTYHPEIDYTQNDIKMNKIVGIVYPLKILVGKLVLSFLCCLYSVSYKYFHVKINVSIGGKELKEYTGQSCAKKHVKEVYASFLTLFLLFRCGFWAMLYKFGLNVDRSICGKRLQEYYNSDVIINTGGDALTDDYNASLMHLSNLLFAVLLNKPVIICAESIGPFKSTFNRFIARYTLNRVDLITLREEHSLKHLQKLGINKPQIYVTADVAFILEPVSNQRIQEILAKEEIKKNRPLIGISVSKIISSYGFSDQKSEKRKYEEYIKLMATIVDYSIENYNVTIVFVPHVILPWSDDRLVADDIYGLLKNKKNVVSIKNEYTPEELKGVIGQCDLFIGARMHACIASTSMLVPTIAIAYSHKTKGIIGKMLKCEKFVIDINDLTYDLLSLKIKDAWANREKIKTELEINIPVIREKARLNGKLIKKLLDDIKTENEIK